MLSEHFIYVRDVGDHPQTGDILYEIQQSTLDTLCAVFDGNLHDHTYRASVEGVLPCRDAADATARLNNLHNRFQASAYHPRANTFSETQDLLRFCIHQLRDEAPYLAECCNRHDRR